jgi:Gas vesicle synthesis protein GvpL/GvpF
MAAEAVVARTGSYLYGVVPARAELDLDPLEPVGGATAVRAVEAGGLCGLVSDVAFDAFDAPGDLRSLAAEAERHERVLQRARAARAVVPVRFGTVLESDADVRRLLERDAERFSFLLERLAGRAEWQVRLDVDRAAAEEQASADDERAAALVRRTGEAGEGGAYLARRQLDLLVRDRVAELAARLAADAHERLAPAAVAAASVSPRRAAEGRVAVLDAAYLVDEDGEQAFRAAVDAVERHFAPLGASCAVAGPWPPYSFVDEEVA